MILVFVFGSSLNRKEMSVAQLLRVYKPSLGVFEAALVPLGVRRSRSRWGNFGSVFSSTVVGLIASPRM